MAVLVVVCIAATLADRRPEHTEVTLYILTPLAVIAVLVVVFEVLS